MEEIRLSHPKEIPQFTVDRITIYTEHMYLLALYLSLLQQGYRHFRIDVDTEKETVRVEAWKT
jgi:hypothetical protein